MMPPPITRQPTAQPRPIAHQAWVDKDEESVIQAQVRFGNRNRVCISAGIGGIVGTMSGITLSSVSSFGCFYAALSSAPSPGLGAAVAGIAISSSILGCATGTSVGAYLAKKSASWQPKQESIQESDAPVTSVITTPPATKQETTV